MVCLLAIATILILFFFDIQYYLRIISTIIIGRLFEKTGKVTDIFSVHDFCFTQDLDLVFKHMNNARFVRVLDFARFHFYDRSGIYSEMVKNKSDALQSATNIRYRRVIPIFTFYKVTTQLVYWDEKNIYVEQKFISSDGFIRAVVLSKQTLLHMNVDDLMVTMKAGPKPECPIDLNLWIQSMVVSSEKLRPKKD